MRVAVITFVCLWLGLVVLSWLMLLRFLILLGVAAILEWRDHWREHDRHRGEPGAASFPPVASRALRRLRWKWPWRPEAVGH